MDTSAPVIAIDGPSGSGKGTVAHRVAQRLGFGLLDSGAIYRALALASEIEQIRLDNIAELIDLGQRMDLVFRVGNDNNTVHLWLSDQDISDAIRSDSCSARTSMIAAIAPVREALLERQRKYQTPPGLVADGRDMGTVVFPEAELKIFLQANVKERARRRYKQLMAKGIDASFESISLNLADRDRRDQQRSVAPLRPAATAVIVDTTEISAESVVTLVLQKAATCGIYAAAEPKN